MHLNKYFLILVLLVTNRFLDSSQKTQSPFNPAQLSQIASDNVSLEIIDQHLKQNPKDIDNHFILQSSLMSAAQNSSSALSKTIRRLLDLKADPNERNNAGYSVLDLAVKSCSVYFQDKDIDCEYLDTSVITILASSSTIDTRTHAIKVARSEIQDIEQQLDILNGSSDGWEFTDWVYKTNGFIPHPSSEKLKNFVQRRNKLAKKIQDKNNIITILSFFF